MPTPVLLSLLIVALPLFAWAVSFLHAFARRRLPGWTDKSATAAILISLGISLYLFFGYVLPHGGIQTPYRWSCEWLRIGVGAGA